MLKEIHVYNKQEIVGPSKYFCKSIGIECKTLSLEEIKKIKDDFIQAIIKQKMLILIL